MFPYTVNGLAHTAGQKSPLCINGLNKSTASGAKYARSSVIFPHRNGLCQGEVDAVKTGPKLNLIKKIWGKRGCGWGGGGGLSYNSNCELSCM